MNSKQIGNITEIETMLSFIKLGYNVLTPYGDCERYDFVADINGKFIRVQSKTAKTDDNGNSFIINGRSSNRKDGKVVNKKYTKEEIDYFATFFNGNCYLIPVELGCGSSKRFRINPPESGQTRGISWAKDFELQEMLKNICADA